MSHTACAFLVPVGNEKNGEVYNPFSTYTGQRYCNEWEIHWFTTKKEIEMCGSATYAAMHVLFDNNFANRDNAIKFSTKFVGTIYGIFNNSSKDYMLNMPYKYILRFPAFKINKIESIEKYKRICNELLNCLGGLAIENIVNIVNISQDLIIELKQVDKDKVKVNSIQFMKSFVPNFTKIVQSEELSKYRMLQLGCQTQEKKYDCIHRVFGPMIGNNEDPVCGSGTSYMAVYWSNKLNKKNQTLHFYPASKRSGQICAMMIKQIVFC